MSAMFNTINFSWINSPAATELETIVLDWLGKMLGLPHDYLSTNGLGGGVIQGTASEATLVSLLAARARKKAVLQEDIHSRLVAYCSDQTHSSIAKACKIAGLREDQCRVILSGDDFKLTREALQIAIEKDIQEGRVPFFVCVTFGKCFTLFYI